VSNKLIDMFKSHVTELKDLSILVPCLLSLQFLMLYVGGAQIFQKSSSHLNILDVRIVT
jgi:hypothetical protein